MARIILILLALLAPSRLAAQDVIDTGTLMQDLRILSADDMAGRATGTPGAERARLYIERRFAELGLTVNRMPFSQRVSRLEYLRGTNVWTLIRGSERPDKVIVVSAHYDHVGTQRGRIYNGADDNASGVSALFAIAAALRRAPPRHSVLLIAFDGEEPGLYGARAFVQAPPVPLADIVLNVNIDMVARGDGGVLWAAGPRLYPALQPLVAAVARTAPIELRFGRDYRPARPGRGRGRDDYTMRSDHGAFGAAGIPFLFFMAGEHSDYHEPTDDAERVEPRFYSAAVTTILATFRRLDADGAMLDTARRTARRLHFR